MPEVQLKDVNVPDSDQADVDLENAVLQLGDDECMVYVHSLEKNGDKTYEGKMEAGEFSWEEVRSRYGGGKRYWAQLIARNERGQIQWTKQGTQQIAKTAEERAAERMPVPAQMGGFDPRSIARELTDALAPMRDRMDRTDRLIETLLTQRTQHRDAPTDPAAMLASMVTAMVQLQNLTPKTEPGQQGSVFKDIRQALELVGELSSNRDNADPIQMLLGTIEKVAPQLLETAQRASAQAAALPRATEQTTTTAAPDAAQATPPAEGQPNMLHLLDDDTKLTMAILLDAAEKDRDPGNYVGIVIDDVVPKIPEAMLPSLLEAPTEYLPRLDARWKSYEAWVNKLIGYVKLDLAEMAREHTDGTTDHAVESASNEGANG